MLRNESKLIRNENWTQIMEKTALKYQDPKAFWRNIRNLKGNKTQVNQYLQVNNTKLTTDREEEQAHRVIWQDVFKISPEENAEYDRGKAEEVERYLSANLQTQIK